MKNAIDDKLWSIFLRHSSPQEILSLSRNRSIFSPVSISYCATTSRARRDTRPPSASSSVWTYDQNPANSATVPPRCSITPYGFPSQYLPYATAATLLPLTTCDETEGC